jgi:PAS domain S-box-containing protein
MVSEILNQVDFKKASELLEGFNKSTGFVSAILDIEGNILCKSGWRQICTDFHRINSDTFSNCLVSDTFLANKVNADGTYNSYKCMNGLIDVSLPIVVRGEHIANLFSGQFFFEKPDLTFFRNQAMKYGFDEQSYLEALGKVPVVSKEKVQIAMEFLLNITKLIIEMTADQIDQFEIYEAIKKSEMALSKSQLQLKQNVKDLLESQRIAHLGTWRLDLATNQVVWSEELYKMYGFDPTIPPPPYTEHMKLFTPESWNNLSSSLEITRTTGVSYELELETVTNDGSNGWMWVRGEAEKDSDGNIVSLWGAAQDITNHKRAVLETRQSEERFQLLFNKAPLGYQSLDDNGCFIEVNQQWLDTLGYDKDEVIGKWFGNFLCPEYIDGFRHRFPIFKSQGFIHSEFEMLSKSGERLTISFEGKVGYGADGNFKQTHCILQDITNQRKAEKALIESEARYRELSERSRTFTWEVDEQGMFTFVDHACETVLGYRPEDLIQNKTIFDLCLDEDREGFKQTAFAIFKRKEMFQDKEISVLTLTGDKVILSVNGFPIFSSDGSMQCFRANSTDITSRKRTEEALQKSEERFRVAQEISPDGFTILSPIRNEIGEVIDFEFAYENDAIARINHTEPQEVVGKRLLELFPSHKGTSIFDTYIHVANTKETRIIDEISVSEMISNPIWLRLVIFSMGEEIAILAHDITQRKKAALELTRIMAQNQRILDNLQDAYVQIDLAGKIVSANPQTLNMFGYSSNSELTGQPIEILYTDHVGQEQMFRELNEIGSITDFILKGYRKNGNDLWVSSNIQYIKDDEKIVGIEALMRDVTDRISMQEEIESQRDNLMVSNEKFAHLFKQSVGAISKIAELRDPYTAGHQRRVTDLSCAIARILGLSEEVILNLSYGSHIHDIGKIYVPAEILNKPGKISAIEFQMIQSHVELGYNIIKEIDFPDVISTMVYQHHERLDGSGYPLGLIGDQILKESRILAVSDVVEAMTSHRPYRPSLGIEAALEEISKFRGQKYDCDVVDACIQLFKEKRFTFSDFI